MVSSGRRRAVFGRSVRTSPLSECRSAAAVVACHVSHGGGARFRSFVPTCKRCKRERPGRALSAGVSPLTTSTGHGRRRARYLIETEQRAE